MIDIDSVNFYIQAKLIGTTHGENTNHSSMKIHISIYFLFTRTPFYLLPWIIPFYPPNKSYTPTPLPPKLWVIYRIPIPSSWPSPPPLYHHHYYHSTKIIVIIMIWWTHTVICTSLVAERPIWKTSFVRWASKSRFSHHQNNNKRNANDGRITIKERSVQCVASGTLDRTRNGFSFGFYINKYTVILNEHTFSSTIEM